MAQIQGLSEREVLERRARGEGNTFELPSSQSYWQIIRRNVFTFINAALFAIGLILILMHEVGNAVVTAGLVWMNVAVGLVQEVRAKRTLDRIALLTRPTATVIRAGQERAIDPRELVRDDVLVINAGDQLVVDGEVIEGKADMDESLLTGESNLVAKHPGDTVYSGSFCVAGRAVCRATQVGAASTANKLAVGARAFRQVKTPLQLDIDLVVRILMFVAGSLGALILLSYAIQGKSFVESVRVAAVIVALVPQGLFFMITLAYAMGAVRIAGRGALIQQANAVESLSNVKILCLDKTGTLTTNRLQVHALHPLTVDEDEFKRLLGDYVANSSSVNRTAETIGQAFPGAARTVCDEAPFSSARKWSALAFDDAAVRGVYVLGAPEMLVAHVKPGAALGEDQMKLWEGCGLRVLLFAYTPALAPLNQDGPGPNGQPTLPPDLVPLGIISLSDELRPEAHTTLKGFDQAGVRLKIISGDNPRTVAALARQAGLNGHSDEIKVVSGLELAEMSEPEFERAALEAMVFGRITPQQKENLVRVLRANGAYVAMIGDGVNDVLSLKQANLSVAMQSGSQATRSVADIVLVNDSFAVLPAAFQEGQRIVNGMQDIVRLFLSRTFYVTLLIIATAIVGMPFPVTPKHNTVLAFLTVGLPTMALAAWSRSGTPSRGLIRSVVHFVLPASFTVAALGMGIYVFSVLRGGDVDVARTALTTVTVLCGLLLIPFAEPPSRFWTGGDELSGDRRPTWLALGMAALFVVVMAVAPLRNFFELVLLRPEDYLVIVLAVVIWAWVLRSAWRKRWFDRFLGFDV
ncbi:MAG: HAD-IC family P-type ATPase [Anaerolineae bacterium]|nr:HAD-IC family P-type ATPase [Anaerolineae bacterium]